MLTIASLITAIVLAAILVNTSLLRVSDTESMILLEGGSFMMGIEHPMMPEASPVHHVSVSPFWIGRTEVTNREFMDFVEATGYVTLAEKPLDPDEFPGVDKQLLEPGSLVFHSPSLPVNQNDYSQWWHFVQGADWKHPQGPESTIRDKMNHPVVHIAWEDAIAYANWKGGRLPTEAEWEYAARGGLNGQEFSWGNRFKLLGRHMANTFQGDFPHRNTLVDGFSATSPVKSFSPNGFGLYDVSGNVWEWVSDWYDAQSYAKRALENREINNPRGPAGPPSKKVMKGGSFLCTDSYCGRFRPGARGRGDPRTSSNHVGFRVAKDISEN